MDISKNANGDYIVKAEYMGVIRDMIINLANKDPTIYCDDAIGFCDRLAVANGYKGKM